MSIPIAYMRLKAVINTLGENQVDNRDSALRLLKGSSKYKSSFLVKNRDNQKLELISDKAILGWFDVGRYWDIVEKESYQLTEQGKQIQTGTYDNQLQVHIGTYIRNRWDADFNTIWDAISRFPNDDRKWPTIDNWHELTTKEFCFPIPKSRFKQMIYFMVGMGLLTREQTTLYTKN